MHHVIIESTGTVKGRTIEGIALVPTVSENGNIYTADEIDKAQNLNTPLKADWEHTAENVGQVVYTLDPRTHTLFYRATITSEKRANEITEGVHKVSIEAAVSEVAKSCTPVRCYNLISGITMEGIGITSNPGVLSTTLSIIESKQTWNAIHEHCPECSNSSLVDTKIKTESMTNSDKPCNCKESKTKEQECPDGKTWNPETEKCEAPPAEKKENLGGGPDDETAGVDQTKPSETPCGDGMKLDGDGKCIPANNEGAGASDSPTIEAKAWAPNQDELNKKLDKVTSSIESLQSKVEEVTKVDEAKTRELFNSHLYSVTKLSPNSFGFEESDIKYVTKEGRAQLKKFGSYSFDVDLSEKWVKENLGAKNYVTEALTFSSGDPSDKINVSNNVFVLPNGKYLKSIRDLVRFTEIPDGVDQVKLPKGNIPDQQTITEGSANSAATHDVITVTLDADTVTGVPQTITQSQVEDVNFSIFDYMAQTARGEVMDHEATLVFDTAAAAATPGHTVNSGGTGVFDVDYLLEGLKYFEETGYPTDFDETFCMLHPDQMEEIRKSTDITRFVQVGDANVTRTGKLTHLYGVRLISAPVVNTATSVHNAVMGVKGHTFWLGSKRDLTIDMRKIPNQSAFDWAWTQRKNAVVFDPASFVEIKSAEQ